MPQIPNNFFTEYEKLLLRNVAVFSKRVQDIYNKAVAEISITAEGINIEGVKDLSKVPAIRQKVQKLLRAMRAEMTSTINDATRKAWDLANSKNNLMVEKVLGKFDMPQKFKDIYFNQNLKAYEAFKARQVKGLNLSDRVWNLLQPFKNEIEAGLAAGINDGRPAAEIARDMKKYLNEPDKLFRRVRDQNGNLQLSKAAKNYNPGQGVYRSSFKNAMRLTRTEINMGYRSSDGERWQQQKFVIGIEIKLSRAHPKFDICDPCAGVYPKSFIWGGWHPQCLCYRVPVIASDKANENLIDEILGIKPEGTAQFKYIEKTPPGFAKYLKENIERIAGWKNKPYWLQDNAELVEKLAPMPKKKKGN